MLVLLGVVATIGGVFFLSLPEVVKNDIIVKVIKALSTGANTASVEVAKTGVGIVKFLLRGTVIGTVAVTGFTVLDMVADRNLQLQKPEVQILKEYWLMINEAGKGTNTDPYMIAAIWRVENSLSPIGPSNRQGIGGFYSAMQAGKSFPTGQLTDEEILRELKLIGEILHSKCRGVDIGYDSQGNLSENQMWSRAECFATYNGSQGSLRRGIYSSNGQVFNNLPGHPETNGLTICLTDGCTRVGTMQHDGYETSYRKIRAHVVSTPQLEGGVVTQPVEAAKRITDKLSGEFQRLSTALDAITAVWKAKSFVEQAYAAVSIPKPQEQQEGKLAWPAPENTWIQFQFGNPTGYTHGDFHNGVDIDSPGFQPFTVTSASSGEVTYAQYMDACNMGVVKVRWTKELEILYVHLDPQTLAVAIGQEVSKGQVIGRVYNGKTTCSDGPHLHFMVQRNGIPIDPGKYLERR